MQKRCSKCHNIFDISIFCKSCKTKDGLSCWCRNCNTRLRMDWFNRNKDKHHKSYHEWYMRNREAQLIRMKDYQKNNSEKVYKSIRKWVSENRDRDRQYKANRRALLRGSKGKITLLEWKWLKEKYFYRCLGCFRQEPEIKLTQDHVVAIKNGGKNIIWNIQPLCVNCNSVKRTKTIDYRYLYLEVDEFRKFNV